MARFDTEENCTLPDALPIRADDPFDVDVATDLVHVPSLRRRGAPSRPPLVGAHEDWCNENTRTDAVYETVPGEAAYGDAFDAEDTIDMSFEH